jgi:hypothetical protein
MLDWWRSRNRSRFEMEFNSFERVVFADWIAGVPVTQTIEHLNSLDHSRVWSIADKRKLLFSTLFRIKQHERRWSQPWRWWMRLFDWVGIRKSNSRDKRRNKQAQKNGLSHTWLLL